MDLHTAEATDQLLGDADIPPVHEVNAEGTSPFLLTADHYGRILPRSLGDLGVSESELVRHIAWDIGIAGVPGDVPDELAFGQAEIAERGGNQPAVVVAGE